MGAGIVRIVTDASFDRTVLGAGRPVLVAFGASWCRPCHLLGPSLRWLAATHRDRLLVAKLDVDDNAATAERFGVETFPVCILFGGGEEIVRLDGYMPLRKIESLLLPHLAPAES